MSAPGRQGGVALITVMLIVTIATIAAVAIVDRQHLDIRRTGNLTFADQALEHALGAEAWAVELLERDGQESEIDHLGEDWALPLRPTDIAGGAIRAWITDLNGRVNPNNLLVENQIDSTAQARLIRLFQAAGLSPEVLPALIDWLDGDIQPTGATGAEDDYYTGLEIPYRAANAPLGSVTELRLLRGMDQEAYAQLAPWLAAIPGGSGINVNTAEEGALFAIGLDQERAQAIIQARSDQPFTQVAEFTAHPALQGLEIDGTRLDVSSRYFLLRAEVQIGQVRFDLLSVLYRDEEGVVSVLSRRQGVI
jgi:general secretion pathway protein K